MQTTVDIGKFISVSPQIHAGCPIIAGTGVTVRRIATDYKMGLSAEEIVKEIPHLTLAQVYAALAYYHANQIEIDADLAFQEAEAERLEAEYKAGNLL